MTQRTSVMKRQSVAGNYENVAENWILYDSCIVHNNVPNLAYNDGWFQTYAALGGNQEVPFFNVRNRNHGLWACNQDTRDAMSYGFRIYTIGVQWFAPSLPQFSSIDTNVPTGQKVLNSVLFTNELPKHTGLILKTNQDERLRINSLMCPPGVGAVGGGVSQGDAEAFMGAPNTGVWANHQGYSVLSNKWGFREPLNIPRRANVSVTLRFNEYAQRLLQFINGPGWHPIRNSLGDGNYRTVYGIAGIRVILGGQRLVQQRDQYHA
jgi:hypothetical protein